LSILRDPRSVNERSLFDIESLIQEIGRYLAAVEAFRREGHEPAWRAEPRTHFALELARLSLSERPLRDAGPERRPERAT
jgi:hypothetical protein